MNASVSYFDDLSLVAQTAYAELGEAVHAQELNRSIASLSGGFASKKVKGRTYWYYQFRDIDNRVRQIYVGPDHEPVRALIAKAGHKQTAAITPLARSAIALGCAGVLPKHFRIIRRIAEYGFFNAGGVLIGTHAFLTCGNMLGVRWQDSSRTQDVDFAHPGKNLTIALPASIKIDVSKAVDSLAMGFLPMSALSGEWGGTYVDPERPDLRIDFLTTRHRGGERPLSLPNLNLVLQPLKFLEFLLEHPAQATVLCEEGAVTVNVPSPARYALHKLIVWGEREQSFRIKAGKDLRQAAALLAYHRDHERTEELCEEWRDLLSRGRGWRTRAKAGRKALSAAAPDLFVNELLPVV